MSTITITVPLTNENLAVIQKLIAPEAKSADSSGKVKKTAPAKEETPETKKSIPAVSKTDVRAIALKLSKAGRQAEIKEIFGRFNAEKLSDIAESDYAALKEALEEAAVNIDG